MTNETIIITDLYFEQEVEIMFANPSRTRLDIVQSQYKEFVFQLSGGEDVSSLKSCVMTIKQSIGNATTVLSKSYDIGLSDLKTGKIVFPVFSAESALLLPDSYVFDVWINLDEKKRMQLSMGTLSVFSKV